MFSYCYNNPVCCLDTTGCMPYSRNQFGESPLLYDGANPSISYIRIPSPGLPNISLGAEGAVYAITENTNYGKYSISALKYELSGPTLSNEGLSFVSADITYMSVAFITSGATIRPFDYLSAEAEISTHSGAYAMVSIWNPSISLNIGSYSVSLTGHLGAHGGGIKWDNSGWAIGGSYNGIGATISVSKR